MHLIDTHTHLYLNEFGHDRDQVVRDAVSGGVQHMLLPNIDSSSIPGLKQMALDYPGVCLPMMGLHPTSVKSGFQDELKIVESLLANEKYVAIGETGLDLYWDSTFIDQQREAFTVQLNWAKKYKLPLIIHARESFRELFDILDRHADESLKGVFHSFAGSADDAAHVMEYGFFVGINGIITFKNSGLDLVVSKISPDHILLETDSPFLAPVPHRGKRNESSYLIYIAERLAGVYGMTTGELAETTTRNARSLFGI